MNDDKITNTTPKIHGRAIKIPGTRVLAMIVKGHRSSKINKGL